MNRLSPTPISFIISPAKQQQNYLNSKQQKKSPTTEVSIVVVTQTRWKKELLVGERKSGIVLKARMKFDKKMFFGPPASSWKSNLGQINFISSSRLNGDEGGKSQLQRHARGTN